MTSHFEVWYYSLVNRNGHNSPDGSEASEAPALSPSQAVETTDPSVFLLVTPCRHCTSTDHPDSKFWWDCPVHRETSSMKSGETGFWDEHMNTHPTWCSSYHDQQRQGKAAGLTHRSPDVHVTGRVDEY